ncbi:trichohyalin-like [Belonocnema kinseyi]|uniref:trichohyalin-like n=1 Tax=Belonocnema kinseyi TaxID=2817044 RepID=UPI00143D59FC|nr:trichohyalin-like [Belonocnema kinseyi]
MYWSYLDEYCSTSSSDSGEFLDSISSNQDYGDFQKNSVPKDDTFSEERCIYQDDKILCRTERNCSPVVQEPMSENDLTECLRVGEDMQSILIRKDEYISNLKKLLSCQREQLYFFLKMSIDENTLAPLKDTCQETDALYDNENLSLALDRFKHKNNFPSEQTLLREDILKSLMRLERLIKYQEKLSRSLENDFLQSPVKEKIDAIEMYQFKNHDIFENKMLSGTQQLFQSVETLRIQLKRIGLIEDERIHLIERVYSLPSSERQYYAHLMMLEREKIRIREEIEELKEQRNNLRETTQILQETVGSKLKTFTWTKKCAAVVKSRSGEEELRIKKALEEKEAAEQEKRESRKRYEEKLRSEMEKYRQELAILQEKQKKDEEDLKSWEMLQRLKRDEFNKEIAAKDFELERLRKQKIAESLRRQIALREAEQKRLALLDVDDVNKIIEKTNEKVLRYGEEVIKESEGVRPLFPIIKVVEQFKKEIGLAPRKVSAKPVIPVKKFKKKRQPLCANPISENQICYI